MAANRRNKCRRENMALYIIGFYVDNGVKGGEGGVMKL